MRGRLPGFHAWPWLLLGTTALALALLLPQYSYWWDEANTIHLVRGSFRALVTDLRTTDGSEAAQPLYYVGLWSWAAVLGPSEIAIRSASLALVFATVPLLALSFRVAGLSSYRAVAASVPFVMLPVVAWYSARSAPVCTRASSGDSSSASEYQVR